MFANRVTAVPWICQVRRNAATTHGYAETFFDPRRGPCQERKSVPLDGAWNMHVRRVRKVAQLELSEFEARAAHRDGHPEVTAPPLHLAHHLQHQRPRPSFSARRADSGLLRPLTFHLDRASRATRPHAHPPAGGGGHHVKAAGNTGTRPGRIGRG